MLDHHHKMLKSECTGCISSLQSLVQNVVVENVGFRFISINRVRVTMVSRIYGDVVILVIRYTDYIISIITRSESLLTLMEKWTYRLQCQVQHPEPLHTWCSFVVMVIILLQFVQSSYFINILLFLFTVTLLPLLLVIQVE